MKKIVIAVVAVAIVAAIAAFSLSRGKKGKAVDVHQIGRTDVVALVTCTGKIEAKRTVDISANVMGEIINLAIEEGQRVEADQFLLQIDSTQLEAQASGNSAALDALRADLRAAVANARQAEFDHQRARRNFEQKIAPEADFERARSVRDGARANVNSIEQRIEQAKAALAGSRDSLSKTTIRAPIAGMVTGLPVEAGEIAVIGTMNNPGTRLMTISDMSVIEAHMEVDETDVPRVALGQRATITIDAFPGQTFAGSVSEIASSPITKPGTDQAVEFAVKIVVDSPPESIRPGFSVAAEIETGARERVVSVPVQALVVQDLAATLAATEAAKDALSSATDAGGRRATATEVEGVYRIHAGKAQFTAVETGLQGDLVVEVVSGLAEGDEVITGPFRTLRQLTDGDLVEPTKDDDAKKAKKANTDGNG